MKQIVPAPQTARNIGASHGDVVRNAVKSSASYLLGVIAGQKKADAEEAAPQRGFPDKPKTIIAELTEEEVEILTKHAANTNATPRRRTR